MTSTIPQDDSNLDITVTEANDLVTIEIQPASFTGTGGNAVDSVNGLTGVVVLDTDDIDQGVTNLYYANTLVDGHLTGGTGVTYTLGDISIGQDVAITADVNFNSVTSDFFGVQHFIAKARETITAGQPVYISGHSGNTPEVMVADYDDPAKMPAFGIASADIANNNNGSISTYGDLKNVDTTGSTEGETWAVGDELFVNGSKLTNIRPTDETQEVQKIAKIIRVHANNGQMFLMGAGRSNDTPNLDHYHVFIGNAGGVEQRQLTYTDILNTPVLPADQTLSFANPNLSISNGNSVDLSALTPTSLDWTAITSTPTTIAGYGITDAFSGDYNDLTNQPTLFSGDYDDLTNKPSLTNLQDVTTIAPDGTSGLTITDAGQTEFQFGSSAKLKWRSQNDGGAVDQWVFDNTGNNIFTGMQWRTSSNRKIFRFDAEAPGGTDPGDGSHTTKFVLSGSNNTFFSKNHNETAAPLTFNSTSLQFDTTTGVNIGGSYTLPTSDGGPDQVIATDGSGNLTFVDQSGGGGSVALDDLTDVALLNLENNDLLMYNSTASEWQNTNLGITVEPTLTGPASVIAGGTYTVTVSNHASYDDVNYFLEVFDGSTKVTTNDQVTDNGDGTLSFLTSSTVTTLEIRCRAQDFGDLQSEIATHEFDAEGFGGTYRYWKFAVIGTSDHAMVDEVEFYSGAGQTNLINVGNMTDFALPVPLVAYSPYTQSSYEAWKPFNGSTGTFTSWWSLAFPAAERNGAYFTFDYGSDLTVNSFRFYTNPPTYFKTAQSIEVFGSSTGAFNGEEVQLGSVQNTGNRIMNLG